MFVKGQFMFVRNAALVSSVFSALVLLTTTAVHAQRLPGGVHPEHYGLTLTPDLKSATFSGEETIDLLLAVFFTTKRERSFLSWGVS